MRRITIMGPCLAVAVFAVACALASSAFAESPTWYECAKVTKITLKYEEEKIVRGVPTFKAKEKEIYDGKYSNKECTEAAPSPGPLDGEGPPKVENPSYTGPEGKYELKEGVGAGKSFKGKSGATALHVKLWVPDQTIKCTSSTDIGSELLPAREANVQVTFKGCMFDATKCETKGEKAGVIKTRPLSGELGYVEESPVEVGVELKANNEEGIIAEFECLESNSVNEVSGKLGGELIGVQEGDVNKVSKDSKTVFVPTEGYGEHEYNGKKYKPLVNIIGWAGERAGILAAEEANEEETDPAHVLRGEFCGEVPEELAGAPCTPPTYTGQEQEVENKGEALEIKAEP